MLVNLSTFFNGRCHVTQFRMSVLLAREDETKRAEEKASAAASSPLLCNHKGLNGTDKMSKVRFYSYKRRDY